METKHKKSGSMRNDFSYILLLFAGVALLLLVTIHSVSSYGEACTSSDNCSICEFCNSSYSCDYISYGSQDTNPYHECASTGCSGDNCSCDGTGSCLNAVGVNCSTNADCVSDKCRFDPANNTNFCIPQDKECVYNLTGAGGYYNTTDTIPWACTDSSGSGDCTSQNHTCTPTGEWECNSAYNTKQCAYCTGDISHIGICNDTATNNSVVEECTANAVEYPACYTCSDDGNTTSAIPYSDELDDTNGTNLCNSTNQYCCGGTCVNAPGEQGTSCAGADESCNGVWSCNGTEYACSSIGSPCAYCIGDSSYNGSCDRDANCSASSYYNCSVCTGCVDYGNTSGCVNLNYNYLDVTLPWLCDDSGNGCSGDNCSCDGTGSCLNAVGVNCSTNADCVSDKCRFDPANNTNFCIPQDKECVYNLTGAGGYYNTTDTIPWACTDSSGSGDCTSQNHTCTPTGEWECNSAYNSDACAYCISDSRFNGTCRDTVKNNSILEECGEFYENCSICKQCIDLGTTNTCGDVVCGIDNVGVLCNNLSICGANTSCYAKLDGGQICDNFSIYTDNPYFYGCAPSDEFCKSGICCTDGLCRNITDGCCLDDDCSSLESCFPEHKTCEPDPHLGNNIVLAQSFTPSIRGFLMEVSVKLYSSPNSSLSAPLTLSIRNALMNSTTGCSDSEYCPGDDILSSQPISGFTNTTPHWINISLSNPPLLESGTRYFIVLSSSSSSNRSYWWSFNTSGYAAGELAYSTDGASSWRLNSSFDLFFKSYISPIKSDIINDGPLSGRFDFGFNRYLAQSFIANKTGFMGIAEFMIKNNDNAPGIVTLHLLKEGDNGYPPYDFSYEIGSVKREDIFNSSFVDYNFSFISQRIMLTKGERYNLLLEACTGVNVSDYSVAITAGSYSNGTVFNRSTYDIGCLAGNNEAGNYTFTKLMNAFSGIVDSKLHLNLSYSLENVSVFQDNETGPWSAGVLAKVHLSLNGIIASWNWTDVKTAKFSIANFEDPLFSISTRLQYTKNISPTNITYWNVSLFKEFIYSHKFKHEYLAPSFLDRLANVTNSSSSCCGIESIMEPDVFSFIQHDSNKSYVDYCFLMNDCPIDSYGSLYNITTVTNDTYPLKIDLYHTGTMKYNLTDYRVKS